MPGVRRQAPQGVQRGGCGVQGLRLLSHRQPLDRLVRHVRGQDLGILVVFVVIVGVLPFIVFVVLVFFVVLGQEGRLGQVVVIALVFSIVVEVQRGLTFFEAVDDASAGVVDNGPPEF